MFFVSKYSLNRLFSEFFLSFLPSFLKKIKKFRESLCQKKKKKNNNNKKDKKYPFPPNRAASASPSLAGISSISSAIAAQSIAPVTCAI
jgi:hypothetical protein